MSDWPAIISTTATALGTGGGGVVWLYRRVDARFKKVEGELEKCRQRELRASEIASKHLLVIELLWQAASKSKAAAPVLARCKEHLDKLKENTP
jgi:hypothetical protein